MRAIRTKHLLCPVFVLLLPISIFSFYSTLTLPPLPISHAHYELYTVCCSGAERAPFPHRWLFWGAGKLDATVLIFFFSFFSFSFSSQRWRGQTLGRITPQRPNRSLLSKASQMHLSELNTYELCTGVGDDSSVTGADGGEGRGGRERDIEWYTGADAPTHSRTRAKRGSDAHNRAHARASIKSKCHWRQDHSKIH